MDTIACPKCGAQVGVAEKFCAACGASVVPDVPRQLSIEAQSTLGGARKWLMAISIITLVSGFIFYAIQRSDVEDQIRSAETQTAGMDPAQRDAIMMQTAHMTWDEAVAHDRGQPRMTLFVNAGLAFFYLCMWFWAKKNALGATITSLLVFITVIAVSAVLDPKTLAMGIVVKILFIAALARAITVARQERALSA